MNIDFARLLAGREIDRVAGRVRLRYLTDAPGQERVYRIKLQQAGEYLAGLAANASPPVPAYISGEARATGLLPAQAAQRIVDAAARWDTVLGPAIEETRTAGKRAVAAASAENLDAVLASVISALDAL